VQVLRVFDPRRRPASWTEIVRPDQLAVFAKTADTDAACDADGQSFASTDEATLVLFDSLDDARDFCERRVGVNPAIQFDLYDYEGKANPPLLTIVSETRASALETHPAALRRRKLTALGLISSAAVCIVGGIVADEDGTFVLPFVVGICLFVAGGRLLLMNLGIRDAERKRQERLGKMPSTIGRGRTS
jgi:hypothetical protein